MNIAYITVEAPYGTQETFILNEINALINNGINIFIYPKYNKKTSLHSTPPDIITRTKAEPLLSFNSLYAFFVMTILAPHKILPILGQLLLFGKFSHKIKNLLVLPKAIWLSKELNAQSINHIHAHWGETTATMSMIASKLTGIPWSFTVHRWDIKENNLLKLKANHASFIRCISQHGYKELKQNISDESINKTSIIHMGVKVQDYTASPSASRNNEIKCFATPANLIPVKGHQYLIQACKQLIAQGVNNFKCIFYGDGRLRKSLQAQIDQSGLNSIIEMPGTIPNEQLMDMYEKKEIDCIVLPSINLPAGAHEGIPVCLMEAMAYGIPVISTQTGGIPELLSNAGILIPEKDSNALASAIQAIIEDRHQMQDQTIKGLDKIKIDFNIENTATALINKFNEFSSDNLHSGNRES